MYPLLLQSWGTLFPNSPPTTAAVTAVVMSWIHRHRHLLAVVEVEPCTRRVQTRPGIPA